MAFFFLSVLYVLCGSSPRRHEANPAMDWHGEIKRGDRQMAHQNRVLATEPRSAMASEGAPSKSIARWAPGTSCHRFRGDKSLAPELHESLTEAVRSGQAAVDVDERRGRACAGPRSR